MLPPAGIDPIWWTGAPLRRVLERLPFAQSPIDTTVDLENRDHFRCDRFAPERKHVVRRCYKFQDAIVVECQNSVLTVDLGAALFYPDPVHPIPVGRPSLAIDQGAPGKPAAVGGEGSRRHYRQTKRTGYPTFAPRGRFTASRGQRFQLVRGVALRCRGTFLEIGDVLFGVSPLLLFLATELVELLGSVDVLRKLARILRPRIEHPQVIDVLRSEEVGEERASERPTKTGTKDPYRLEGLPLAARIMILRGFILL